MLDEFSFQQQARHETRRRRHERRERTSNLGIKLKSSATAIGDMLLATYYRRPAIGDSNNEFFFLRNALKTRKSIKTPI